MGPHFEKEIQGGITKYRHYILGGGRRVAIHTRPSSGAITTRYVHRDHLNSVVALTEENGTIVEQHSFDAFGKRRKPDWTADPGDLKFAVSHLTERGYTGHEHLDNVQLTHMNGRTQDSIIGRMISADPFIVDPVNSQNYNRYSYVLNRPLSLIDRNGFFGDDPDPRDVFPPSDICSASGIRCDPSYDSRDSAAQRQANASEDSTIAYPPNVIPRDPRVNKNGEIRTGIEFPTANPPTLGNIRDLPKDPIVTVAEGVVVTSTVTMGAVAVRMGHVALSEALGVSEEQSAKLIVETAIEILNSMNSAPGRPAPPALPPPQPPVIPAPPPPAPVIPGPP